MGFLSNFMGQLVFLLVLSFLIAPGRTHFGSNEEGYISVLISNTGIDFAKEVLIDKAVSSMIPLQLPDIERTTKIPLLGRVRFVLSNISINSVSFASSYADAGESTGLVLVATGATADMTLRWKYSYSNWVVVISDSGDASVQVSGMEVWLSVALREEEGTIKLTLMGCGCNVKDISIKLDGGASWLYQALVDVFEKPIGTAVEKAVSKKLTEGISKLDFKLQSLPKRITVGHVAALNVTFVENPALSNSSIELEINGLLTAADDLLVRRHYFEEPHGCVSQSSSPPKMLRILLHEDVLNSATLVYFNTGNMHWTIDKLPNQSLLNTAAWEYAYPDLFKQYPNDDMNLHVSLTSAPAIKIFEHDLDATISLVLMVNVFEDGEVVPVACVSLVISSSCSLQIVMNNLVGTLELQSFSVSLNWSKIGDLDMHQFEPMMSTILETAIIPYVNLRLMNGIPLPVPRGFAVQDGEIHYSYTKVIVLCDIAIIHRNHLSQQPLPLVHSGMLL